MTEDALHFFCAIITIASTLDCVIRLDKDGKNYDMLGEIGDLYDCLDPGRGATDWSGNA